MASCTRAGCSGTIEEGYCDACGMAGGASTKAASKAVPTVPAAASVTTGTHGSPSTRTGSARSARSTRSTRSTRSGSSRTGHTATRALGGINLARPPLPPQDPLAAIVPGEVPDRKRFCSGCDAKLSRDAGFCPKCGQEYSFKPTLVPGDVVGEKYEIKGTLAFGGLGWIYLALDTVLSRWVIMKGILNAKDPRMLEVAVKEREYLAAVKHPSIVAIYDFITHATADGNQGFIVMEFVNGKTLMALRKERGGPLPAAEAISYILEILPAFQYLDDLGMVYCDFKPDNAMVEESTVKLIDLGAVRNVDDHGGDIYGSVGYSAPEASSAPTPLSDLYTVGRALAVLVGSFDFQAKYERSLPPPSAVEAFEKYESLYRFLKKATRTDPAGRFQSASEMAVQLVGVLRDVVAIDGGADLGRVESDSFEHDSDPLADSRGDKGESPSRGLPKLRVDRDDAASNIILAAGAVGDAERRLAMFERALKVHGDSLVLKMRCIDERITLGEFARAEADLTALQKTHGDDWRLAWMRGRALLAQGKTTETLRTFEQVLDEMPGELAPQHALGRAYETSGDLDRAVHYYDAVSRADPTFASAALGLARCLERKRDRAGAVAAYRRVPSGSSRYAHAQMALARALSSREYPTSPTVADLVAAGEAVEVASTLIDGMPLHRLRADLFCQAFESVVASKSADGPTLLGVAHDTTALRSAAESELRICARLATGELERIALVDEANRVRPQTWV